MGHVGREDSTLGKLPRGSSSDVMSLDSITATRIPQVDLNFTNPVCISRHSHFSYSGHVWQLDRYSLPTLYGEKPIETSPRERNIGGGLRANLMK